MHEQLELFEEEEEEEEWPTFKEIMEDGETFVILGAVILFMLLSAIW